MTGGGAAGAATRSAPALQVEGISKSFSGKTVLHPFDLSIAPGEIHAMLGQNGSGKSTLIKILAGFHAADPGGRCRVLGEQLTLGSSESARRMGLRFVHQDLGLVGSCSVLDNLSYVRGFPTAYGTIRTREARKHCREALQLVGLDVSVDALVSALTPAQRTGVAVARALHGSGERAVALVLDEPTATLPPEEVDHLHNMLRRAASSGVAILYVTHHLDEVYKLADRVSVLRDGRLVVTARVPELARPALVHHLIGGELEGVMREIARTHHGTSSDHVRFDVHDLWAPFLNGASFSAAAGEIVGLYGITGSGRESVLATVFGALPRDSGTVKVDGVPLPRAPRRAIAAGLGYLPPDRKVAGGFMTLTAAENMTIVDLKPFWKRGWLRDGRLAAETRQWFELLEVRPVDGWGLPLASFSGGNQQKVLFGKWLRTEPKVFLMDEPTQGVDVGAKAELHRQIIKASENGAAVIISSTDLEELATLCDRVLIMQEGRITAELSGGDVTESNINSRSLAVANSPEGS